MDSRLEFVLLLPLKPIYIVYGFSARICFAITGTFNEIVVFGITLPQEIVFILGVTKRNLGP